MLLVDSISHPKLRTVPYYGPRHNTLDITSLKQVHSTSITLLPRTPRNNFLLNHSSSPFLFESPPFHITPSTPSLFDTLALLDLPPFAITPSTIRVHIPLDTAYSPSSSIHYETQQSYSTSTPECPDCEGSLPRGQARLDLSLLRLSIRGEGWEVQGRFEASEGVGSRLLEPESQLEHAIWCANAHRAGTFS